MSVLIPANTGRSTRIKTTGDTAGFKDYINDLSKRTGIGLKQSQLAEVAKNETIIEERQRLGRKLSKLVQEAEREKLLEYPDGIVVGLTTRPILYSDITNIPEGSEVPENLYACEVKYSDGCRSGQRSSTTGTLNDPAMGAHHKSGECHQYQCSNCPGHFGYHKFPEPIIHPFFLGTILQILSVICSDCGRSLFTDSNLIEVLQRIPKTERLSFIQEQLGKNTQYGITCPHINAPLPQDMSNELRELGINIGNKSCGLPRHYLIKESQENSTIYYTQEFFEIKEEEQDGERKDVKRKKVTKNALGVDELINILSKINEETAELMGLDREFILNGYILRGILILPPICRPPPSYAGMESKKEHDFTVAINNILKASEALENAKNDTNSQNKVDRHRTLYTTVHAYFTMLVKSLSGKEGFMRSGMTAKRGDHAARAVIGPALPSTPFGWIEMPAYMAKRTRIPELVTQDNIKHLQKLMKLGKIHQIITGENVVKTVIPGKSDNIIIDIGYTVEREIENGDWVVANRAPSIQQQNVSAHRVIVVNNRSTLGIPTADLPPKGGDYDGDEMSIWPGLSMEARSELRKSMDIRRNIISSQTSTPITGLILNSITIPYILTDNDTFVKRNTFYDCISLLRSRDQLKTLNRRLANAKIHPLSGKALFSALLPEGFGYNNYGIEIADGILVGGKISSLVVGAGKNRSIIHMLWHFAGFKRTAEFISDAAYLVDRWNLDYGFSLTLDDFIHADDLESIKKIDDLYNAAQKYYEDIGLGATDIDLMNAVRHVSNIGVDILEDDNRKRQEKYRLLSLYTQEEANESLLESAIDKIVETDSLKTVLKEILSPLYKENFPRSIPVLDKSEILSTLIKIINGLFADEINQEKIYESTNRTNEEFMLHYFGLLSQDPEKIKTFAEMIRKADFEIPHQQRLLSAISRNFSNERLAELLRQVILPLRNPLFSKTFYMLSRGDMFAGLIDVITDVFRNETATFETDEDMLIHYLDLLTKDSNKLLQFQSELYKEMEFYSQVIFDVAAKLGTSKQNAMLLMSKKMAGGKGTAGNIGEIFGPKGMSSTSEGCLERNIPGNRISVFFAPEDPSLTARGMCKGNFMRGLDVEESLSHAQASREPQAHSSTLLPDLGFTRRQLARALENLVIENGTQVIDRVTGMLIQTIYGGDGFLPQELVNIDGEMNFADIINYSMQLNTEFGWIPDFKPDPKVYSDEHHLYPSYDIGDRPKDIFDIKAFDLMTIDIDDEEDAYNLAIPIDAGVIIATDGWDLS